jgi:hypothetical protein
MSTYTIIDDRAPAKGYDSTDTVLYNQEKVVIFTPTHTVEFYVRPVKGNEFFVGGQTYAPLDNTGSALVAIQSSTLVDSMTVFADYSTLQFSMTTQPIPEVGIWLLIVLGFVGLFIAGRAKGGRATALGGASRKGGALYRAQI